MKRRRPGLERNPSFSQPLLGLSTFAFSVACTYLLSFQFLPSCLNGCVDCAESYASGFTIGHVLRAAFRDRALLTTTNSLDSNLSSLPPSGAENEAMSHGRTGWPGKFTQSLAAFKRLLCPAFRPIQTLTLWLITGSSSLLLSTFHHSSSI